jgi:hypothetical protein
MELAIRPADLHAAAALLATCAGRLEDAGLTFARRAQHNVPDLGSKALPVAVRGTAATERAIGVITTDITALARALDRLAEYYPRVDTTAVPRR